MKRLLIALFTSVLIFLNISCCDYTGPQELLSPDGRVAITFNLDDQQAPFYSVSKDGKPIVFESALALELDSGLLSQNLSIIGIDRDSKNETYNIPVGKSKEVHNHYNELIAKLQENGQLKRRLNIIFRAYDDGAAFRYQIPESAETGEFTILSEKSEFRFADDHKCWALQLKNFNTNYESEFNPIHINDIQPGSFIGLPLTIEIKDGPYLTLTEANLTDYAGMYLEGFGGEQNTLVSRLSPMPDTSGICVKGTAPHYSPWRVIMIGDQPGDLIESNIILNLNEPSAIADPSWIKPGRVAWPWWSGRTVKNVDFEGGMNTATQKHYIDFAAEFGLEYLLIDALWYGPHKDPSQDITTTVPEIDLPEIIAYARERNVDVMIWLNWENTRKQMDEAFALYEKWGIKGVKIDYMNRDDQEVVNFYHDVVKKAAEHHLLVDFHGAYKPTGIRRTYPNFITREGILGLEHTKWSKRVTPEHNVTIPFTRMVTGPMDYTPGAFRNVTEAAFESQRKEPMAMGTRAHHLASFVVYESPLQMVSDYPASYRGEAGAEFLKIVPVTWDETKVLTGQIGDYIAIARKSGNDWYIGAMTDWDARTLKLPLDFLGDGEYEAHIYMDAKDAGNQPTHLSELKKKVLRNDKLQAEMQSGGGYVVHFKLLH